MNKIIGTLLIIVVILFIIVFAKMEYDYAHLIKKEETFVNKDVNKLIKFLDCIISSLYKRTKSFKRKSFALNPLNMSVQRAFLLAKYNGLAVRRTI